MIVIKIRKTLMIQVFLVSSLVPQSKGNTLGSGLQSLTLHYDKGLKIFVISYT